MEDEEKRYEIDSIENAFKVVEDFDDGTKKVYDYYIKDFPKSMKFTGVYMNKKAILEAIKERVIDGLQEEFTELKSRISVLRKKGEDIFFIDMKLSFFPSKLHFFKADFSLKNYNVVKDIIFKTKKSLEKYKDIE